MAQEYNTRVEQIIGKIERDHESDKPIAIEDVYQLVNAYRDLRDFCAKTIDLLEDYIDK